MKVCLCLQLVTESFKYHISLHTNRMKIKKKKSYVYKACLRDWSKTIGWGGPGAFGNTVDKKHMAHPSFLSVYQLEKK